MSALKDFDEMLARAGATGSDHGNLQRGREQGSKFAFEACGGAVAVHGGEQDFASATGFGFVRPGERIATGRSASASGEDFVTTAGGALGVDRDNGGLRAEAIRDLRDEFGIADGGGVNADFIGACVEDRGSVVESANAAAHGERNEEAMSGLANHGKKRGAIFVSGSDVEEDDLVGSSSAVRKGKFGGLAGIAQCGELHAFHDAAVFDIKARDDAFGQHGRSQKFLRMVMPMVEDFSGWNWTPKRLPRSMAAQK